MEGVKGVLYAITCLAGVYVYDYQPLEDIKQRIQQRFVSAERRLSYLLAKEKITTTQVGELITISNVLSMLDVSRLTHYARCLLRHDKHFQVANICPLCF